MLYATLVLAAASVAADQPAKKPARPDAKASAPPASAVKVDDVTYRWTDEKGRAWVYRRTPFGWAKIDESARVEAVKATGAVEPAPKSATIRAFEEGDNVRFEKDGPFGVYSWKKKKTDLLPEETLALENARKLRK